MIRVSAWVRRWHRMWLFASPRCKPCGLMRHNIHRLICIMCSEEPEASRRIGGCPRAQFESYHRAVNPAQRGSRRDGPAAGWRETRENEKSAHDCEGVFHAQSFRAVRSQQSKVDYDIGYTSDSMNLLRLLCSHARRRCSLQRCAR